MPIRSSGKLKNSLFFIYFFNKDISFNIPWKFLKFVMYVHTDHLEGTVSQIFFLGPSSHFMKSTKKSFKKCKKVTRFFT